MLPDSMETQLPQARLLVGCFTHALPLVCLSFNKDAGEEPLPPHVTSEPAAALLPSLQSLYVVRWQAMDVPVSSWDMALHCRQPVVVVVVDHRWRSSSSSGLHTKGEDRHLLVLYWNTAFNLHFYTFKHHMEIFTFRFAQPVLTGGISSVSHVHYLYFFVLTKNVPLLYFLLICHVSLCSFRGCIFITDQ